VVKKVKQVHQENKVLKVILLETQVIKDYKALLVLKGLLVLVEGKVQ
jgi:hypothetical protein